MSSKKIAVMQPYLFPYIGYFQLILAVDKFVFLDDVDYIKNGWINRNRILHQGRADYITIPCRGASSFVKINEVDHGLNDQLIRKLLRKITFSYKGAPFFESVFTLFENVISLKTSKISELAIYSVKKTCDYIGLNPIFEKSSVTYINDSYGGADRLINICKTESANTYINPIGGKPLYSKAYFYQYGIYLNFLESEQVAYQQFNNTFIPGLSVLDVMMFNHPEEIKNHLLKTYSLV